MQSMPEAVSKSLTDRKGPAVFATVAEDHSPNIVWIGWLEMCGDDKLIMADNYFSKTRENILAGSKAAVLWITEEGQAYQVKGPIEYVKEGPMYDQMKQCMEGHDLPGVAAVVVQVEEVYSGAEKLL